MSVTGKLRALRRKVDELGPLGAVRLAITTAAQSIFSRDEILYTLDLRTYATPDTARADGGATRRIAAYDALGAPDREALREYGGEAYLDAARARLGDGWVLFLVDLDGRPAGGGWVLTTATPLVAKIVPILDDECVLIDCFTFPEHRGRNAYPHMLAGVAEAYRAEGARRAWIFTRCHNAASIRGIEKAGFTPTAIYQVFTIGAREIVWWKGKPGRAG